MFPADLPLYFCGIPFRAHQVGRKLPWLLARGEIRQLISGVYVDVRVPETIALRADALHLVVPSGATVCGRAAAWLHGIDSTALAPEPFRPEWTFAERPAVEIQGLMVTTPAATAIELVKQLPRPFALSAVDGLLHAGMPMSDLVTASAAYFPADSTSQEPPSSCGSPTAVRNHQVNRGSACACSTPASPAQNSRSPSKETAAPTAWTWATQTCRSTAAASAWSTTATNGIPQPNNS
ncbi:hypothetical protein [Kribbella speibonae]|uniref:hypothetical protein n=1 Tax=Kribbella speibonae TaxID=1572660 RepID=UPI001EE000B7|nr:hypothetical protein [Kribbella speibonae]